MDPRAALPSYPFGSDDLPRLGLSETRLRRLVADGAVHRVLRGVYVAAGVENGPELRARAAGLVMAEGQVLRDRTAAWVHGVDVYSYAELETTPLVETCALPGAQPTRLAGIDGRTRDLAPYDVLDIGGVAVTTPLRTALDLGCHLRRREAYAAINELAHRHDLSVRDLVAELPRFRGRRGVRQLRPLLAIVDPRVESQRESWTLLAIHDAGLPVPTLQHWVDVDGVPTYRLDFAYLRRRVYVEYDGFDAHERDQAQRDHDRRRRAVLREQGWRGIVVRRGDFGGADGERWVHDLRAALAAPYSSQRWQPRRPRPTLPAVPA
ncbi:hypothetical protein JK386_05120 [Nocardioides sp. zg-536]|uniref:DUF559 domain-containing protein n=1 Tax=Nocardioides faecalis TaxID=2803858 RepID=A0A938Y4U0_9ACTN|nr:type IV toxin-antitoxin system AbiEi family antitoxin domain-containing protein [Nocardioides faecalis]MBM9459275.1 hypothetical protein [Nocardioides faecalis]QVI59598.1 hypothetical protein KG111_04395 [Nocardioides faecalis]